MQSATMQAVQLLDLPTELLVKVLTAIAHQGETESVIAFACTHSSFAAILKSHHYLIQTSALHNLWILEDRATQRLRRYLHELRAQYTH